MAWLDTLIVLWFHGAGAGAQGFLEHPYQGPDANIDEKFE
jgi:hypothetical protein